MIFKYLFSHHHHPLVNSATTMLTVTLLVKAPHTNYSFSFPSGEENVKSHPRRLLMKIHTHTVKNKETFLAKFFLFFFRQAHKT
jgi:hypothetical protein